MSGRSIDIGIAEFRKTMAAVINNTAVRGQITYITSNGRRIAALVPVPGAEEYEGRQDLNAPEH